VKLKGGEESLAVKLASLVVNIPVSAVLWGSAKPPPTKKKRLKALNAVLAKLAFHVDTSFIANGGMSALIEVVFCAW
jgi:hypothetical protein